MTSVDPLEALSRAAKMHEAPSDEDFRAVRVQLREHIAAAGVATATLASATGVKAAALTAVSVAKTSALTSVVAYFVGGTVLGGALCLTAAPRPPHAETVAVPAVTQASTTAAQSRTRLAPRPAPSAAVEPATETTDSEQAALTPSRKPESVPRRPERASSVSARAPVGTPSITSLVPASEASRAAVISPAGSLAREARGLGDVQAALRDGKAALALELLERQDQEYSRGALGVERVAARVVALCALGRVGAARSLAESFALEHPDSPLLERVRNSCAR